MEEGTAVTRQALAERKVRSRAAGGRRGRHGWSVLHGCGSGSSSGSAGSRRRARERRWARQCQRRAASRLVVVFVVKDFEAADVADAAYPVVHVALAVGRQEVDALRRADVEHVCITLLAALDRQA